MQINEGKHETKQQKRRALKKAQKRNQAYFARHLSAYIPAGACQRELDMQVKRRVFGLKTGHYVKWPDPTNGPQIILARKAAEPKYVEAAKIYMEQKAKAEEQKNVEGKSGDVGPVDGDAKGS